MKRSRAWVEDKARERSDISRLAAEDRERTKFEERARKSANVVNRAAVEASAKIRFSGKI